MFPLTPVGKEDAIDYSSCRHEYKVAPANGDDSTNALGIMV